MQDFCREKDIALRRGEKLCDHTTFKIGGPADWFALPDSAEKLGELLAFAGQRGIPAVVIGRGSNLLAPDEGFRGLVVSTVGLDGCALLDGGVIEAGAGLALSRLSAFAARNGLAGLEFAQGIPGSVGGAVVMNAGAYDGEVAFVLQSSDVLLPGGAVRRFSLAEHELGYRSSWFRRHPDAVVLSSRFALQRGSRADIEAKMAEFARRRREKQPLEYPSAGSAYKRPQGHFAGALIEQCGLRGRQIGGARVSDKHAGFIINAGGATARDVLLLMEEIEKTVAERTGVALEREIRLLGG